MATTITVIPGDGIGNEVVPAGIEVLEKVGAKLGIEFQWDEFDWSCERYHNVGSMMPTLRGMVRVKPTRTASSFYVVDSSAVNCQL